MSELDDLFLPMWTNKAPRSMSATMAPTTTPASAALERPWEDEGKTGVADNKAVLVVAVAGEVDVGA